MSLKTWYKSVSKVTNDQLQWAKDVITGKPSPVPNDPIYENRAAVENLFRLLQAMEASALHFIKVLEALKEKEPHAVALGTAATSGPYDTDLKTAISSYTRCHSSLLRPIDEHLGSMQQILHEIKNKIVGVLQVQKKYDLRDRFYQKVDEEQKKWQRAMDTGDPKVIEKRSKAEKAKSDFEVMTIDLQTETENLFRDRGTFITSMFETLRENENKFYRDLATMFGVLDATALAELQYMRGGSPIRPSSVGNPLDDNSELSPPYMNHTTSSKAQQLNGGGVVTLASSHLQHQQQRSYKQQQANDTRSSSSYRVSPSSGVPPHTSSPSQQPTLLLPMSKSSSLLSSSTSSGYRHNGAGMQHQRCSGSFQEGEFDGCDIDLM